MVGWLGESVFVELSYFPHFYTSHAFLNKKTVTINDACLVGYEPYQVTHASDNFQQLYDLAVDLVRR